jgi:hypothetical protein
MGSELSFAYAADGGSVCHVLLLLLPPTMAREAEFLPSTPTQSHIYNKKGSLAHLRKGRKVPTFPNRAAVAFPTFLCFCRRRRSHFLQLVFCHESEESSSHGFETVVRALCKGEDLSRLSSRSGKNGKALFATVKGDGRKSSDVA